MSYCIPKEILRNAEGGVYWVCTVCNKESNGFDLAEHFPNKIYRPCSGGVHRGNVKTVPPAMPRRALNFTIAAIKHIYNRMPTCTQSQIDDRVAICKVCEYYKPDVVNPDIGICAHPECGCCVDANKWLVSKLAWADQECPIKKWLAIK